MRGSLLGFVVVGAAFASACATPARVKLPAPPSAASTYEERDAYIDALRADVDDEGVATLKDGTRIEHPSDLRQVLPDDAPAMEAVSAYESAARWQMALVGLSPVPFVVVTGATLAVAGSAFYTAETTALQLEARDAELVYASALLVGGAASLVALGVGGGMVAGGVWLNDAKDEARQAAFTSYNDSLYLLLRGSKAAPTSPRVDVPTDVDEGGRPRARELR